MPFTRTPQFPKPSQLPDWGPYSKKYIGISHVVDPDSGMRFDLSVFPGRYRRDVKVPNVRHESGFAPWECAPDYSYYRNRHSIEGLDDVYTDVSFSDTGEGRMIQVQLVNRTNVPQSLSLHLLASMHYPLRGRQTIQDGTDAILKAGRAALPAGGLWVDAEAYSLIDPDEIRHWRHLPYAGEMMGLVKMDGLTGGRGIGPDLFESGGSLTWKLPKVAYKGSLCIVLRYRMQGPADMLRMEGMTRQQLPLQTSNDFTTICSEPFVWSATSTPTIQLSGKGIIGLVLDGFAIVEADKADQVRFSCEDPDPAPEILHYSEQTGRLILRYRDLPGCYGMAWENGHDFRLRRFRCDSLDRFLRETANNNVGKEFGGSKDNCYENVHIQPVSVGPESEITLHACVCHGEEFSVRRILDSFQSNRQQWLEAHKGKRSGIVRLAGNPESAPFRFSQELMAANVLTNLVYPVACRGKWIKHFSPGRWWDTLYTWDSGFTALGLSEIDPALSLSHIDTYLAGPETPDQAAFVHYGTPVPTQIYAFKELWNRFPDKTCLPTYFPKFLHYYRFFSGKLAGTTTNRLGSNLVTTWDYFYNSGGWDDYPPQEHVHREKLTGNVAPIANTAHTIRFAKILKGFASILGMDTSEFDQDIARYSEAIALAWDEDSGYYGYLVHDDLGRPREILRHPETGANFNMGMDGLAPLLTGIGPAARANCLRDHLMDPEGLWTPIGMTTVSQSAPYYRRDGYWNGAVWMPHQWFFWKALLDIGDGASAHKVALTALKTWATEAVRSHRCFEHFIVETGRGVGWHHFSALSSPVLSWYAAYFRPGTLSVGHDATVTARAWSETEGRFTADILFEPGVAEKRTVLVVLPENHYKVFWNANPVDPVIREGGCLEITVDANTSRNTLLIEVG